MHQLYNFIYSRAVDMSINNNVKYESFFFFWNCCLSTSHLSWERKRKVFGSPNFLVFLYFIQQKLQFREKKAREMGYCCLTPGLFTSSRYSSHLSHEHPVFSICWALLSDVSCSWIREQSEDLRRLGCYFKMFERPLNDTFCGWIY